MILIPQISKNGQSTFAEWNYNLNGGDSAEERVTQFRNCVETHYGIKIPVRSSFREPALQSRMHIAHMIVYNAFKRKPKYHGSDGTISWDHLSDPNVKWADNSFRNQILKCKDGSNPVTEIKNGKLQWKSEPNESITRNNARAFLLQSGAAEGGKAQIACGHNHCEEPCLCGGSMSHHCTRNAIDLGHVKLKQLEAHLAKNQLGTLDQLLAQFGLHRPLLKVKPTEFWHVEPLETLQMGLRYC